jgi:chloride channel 7
MLQKLVSQSRDQAIFLFLYHAAINSTSTFVFISPLSTGGSGPHTPSGNGRFTDADYEIPGASAYVAEYGHHNESSSDLLNTSRRRRPSLRGLFTRGNDLESAHTSHTYTTREKRKLQAHESIDYLAPSSRVYRRWLSAQPWNRYWDRWLLMAAIGIAVGTVGFTLHFIIHTLAFIKNHGTRWLLGHAHISIGWVFNVSFSLALVYASTWLVVNIAPEAAGAGVAEVMAYLNGTHMPKVMNLKTLGVKFLSAALAVGSGLPVGPEGPMVHIGATIASGMSQGHSTTLGWDSGLLKRFQNPKDKRDFVTAGAAVGVATAFSAPIGGLLFVFEEVASFWQQALGWQIFFACMLAVLTADTLRSAVSAVRDGTFGLFDKEASTVFFEVQTQLTNHVFAVLPAAVCGLVSGLMAIFFTFINLRVTRLRAELLRTKFQKMMEPCVLIVLFVTLGTLLPLFFPCTPTQCVVIQGESTPVCPEGTPPRIQRIVEDTIELYTCSPAAATSDIPPDWDTDPAKGNITVPKAYNELATLMSVTGEDAIRHLLSRGTHKEFGYAAILCMLVFYFLGAAVTAGSAISSGTFVPMLLIGACIGRLIGLVTVNIAAAHGAGSEGAPPGVFLPPSPWAWIDPGAFALIGAGAFMGGVTRMTLALAVIIMEMSNDVRILLPAMVAIMLAKWVADAASHSLYHGLLEVKCVPFLPKELPIADVSLDLLEVRYVMAAPVVTLREKMRLGEVRDVLRSTRHNGFPVVRPSSLSSSNGENGGGGDGGNTTATNNNINSYKRDLSKEYGGTNASSPYAAAAEQQDVYLGFSSDNNDGVFIGIAARDHLLRLLLEAVRRGTAQHLELTYPDLNHHHIDPSILAKEEEQQLAVLEGRPPTPQHFPAAPALWDETLDLTPYINMAAYRVPESFSVERAYVLFSTMGLRHLVVVDENNRVRGIVTRKDLLGYRLDEAVMRARTGAPGAAELLSPIEADRGDLSLA